MSGCCNMTTPAGAQYPPSGRKPSIVYSPFKEEMEPRELFRRNPFDDYDDDECLAYPMDVTPPRKRRFQRSRVTQGQMREMGERARCKFQQKKKCSIFGKLEDYADPSSWNSVPALINYCIAEIETRAFVRCGLYSAPGCRDAVMDIINYFIEIGPNATLLMEYDMHVLANCIIFFLSNLEEPLIPECMRDAFFSAGNKAGNACGNTIEIKELVSQLPAASQDTLRRICPHLLTITKIQTSNQKVLDLASVFGPIVFGISECEEGYDQSIDAMVSMIQTLRFS